MKDGKPVYDVVAIADGKSIASKEKDHPLNPQNLCKVSRKFWRHMQGFCLWESVAERGRAGGVEVVRPLPHIFCHSLENGNPEGEWDMVLVEMNLILTLFIILFLVQNLCGL